MKKYIEMKGQYLIAPSDTRFSLKLIGAGWIRTGKTLRTNDFDMAMDFVQFFHPDLTKAIAETLTAEQRDKTFIGNVPDGFELYSYQNESVAYILRHKHTLVAEDCGLGKTPIAIAAMNHDKPKRTLIIVPASLKYNWKDELERWSTYDLGKIHITDGDDIDLSADVLIINYDILDRHYKGLYAIEWDYLICDEAHKLKSFNSKRTNIVFGGQMGKGKEVVTLEGIHAKTREIYASATPLDKHEHLWPILTRADPNGLGKDWNEFAYKYCGAYKGGFGQKLGKSTKPELLGTHLRARFMIRHNAEDVLDLPPLIEETILFPLSSVVLEAQEETIRDNLEILLSLADAEGVTLPSEPTQEDFINLIGDTFLEQSESMKKPEFAPLFNKMATFRKDLGIAKVPLVIDLLKLRHEQYGKVICFGYHKEVIKQLCLAFPNHVKIVGGMTAKKKNEAVRAFQDTDIPFFFGNISAAGEGITLTTSHYECFAEFDWNYTTMLQAKKRAHRISQTKQVNVDYLVIDESMDSIMAKKVAEKGKTNKGVFAE